ncbi:MAG: hypothetical protein NTW65_04480 [Deltaproteobacteria bacterium]|nr:hypothetical protein [Deltaproteobacteria bacterium]
MKYIENANQYVIFCLTVLLLLLGLNSFFFIMKEAFGYGCGTFLFPSVDRFADTIKTSLSYKELLQNIPNFNMSIIDNLDPLYQQYFFNNNYLSEELSHFHLMPLTTLLCILVCYAIGYGLSPSLIMWTLFLFCIILLYFSTNHIIKSYKKSLLLVVLVIVSYPLIYIVTRGNYAAFLCGIGVLAFLNSLFINKKLDFLSLFLFSIALNFRPNALLILLALPLLLGIRESLWPAFKIGLISLLIYVLIYFIVHYIYHAYTITTFLNALAVYNNSYFAGISGLFFNSSLHGALKLLGALFEIPLIYATLMFYIFSVIILIILAMLVFKKKSITEYYPFILSSVYILLTPVAGDYHLIIFVFPLFIIYTNYDIWKNDRNTLILITTSTLLLLSPKNYYFFAPYLSLQIIINPMIMLLTTLYLLYKNEKNNLLQA